MNFKNTNTKRLVTLAAIIAVCAACLVTAAYAYSAEYRQNVSEQSISVESNSGYITITANDSLQIPKEIKATVTAQYITVTEQTGTSGSTTYIPSSWDISFAKDSETLNSGSVYFDEKNNQLAVKIGSVKLTNNTNAPVNAKMSADGSVVPASGTKAFSSLNSGDIKFKTTGHAFTDTFAIASNGSQDIEVWIVSEVPSNSPLIASAATDSAAATSTATSTLSIDSFAPLRLIANTVNKVIYVSSDGANTDLNGTTPDNPASFASLFKSSTSSTASSSYPIQELADSVSAGDTIIVSDSVSAQSLTFLGIDREITIEGASADNSRATLNGYAIVINDGNQEDTVTFRNIALTDTLSNSTYSNVTLINCSLQNKSSIEMDHVSITLNGLPYSPSISNDTVTTKTDTGVFAVYLGSANKILISNCTFEYKGNSYDQKIHALEVSGCASTILTNDFTMTDSTISGFTRGVNCDGATSVAIKNVKMTMKPQTNSNSSASKGININVQNISGKNSAVPRDTNVTVNVKGCNISYAENTSTEVPLYQLFLNDNMSMNLSINTDCDVTVLGNHTISKDSMIDGDLTLLQNGDVPVALTIAAGKKLVVSGEVSSGSDGYKLFVYDTEDAAEGDLYSSAKYFEGYKALKLEKAAAVSDAETLLEAISTESHVVLTDDIRLTQSLSITKDIVLDGNNHKITAVSSASSKGAFSAISIGQNVKNVTIKDLYLCGESDNGDNGRTYGIRASGHTDALNILVDNVTVEHFGYKGISAQNSALGTVTITGCKFIDAAYYSKAVDIKIKNPTTSSTGLTFEGGDHAVQFDLRNNNNSTNPTITITDCSFTGNNGCLAEISVCDSAKTNTTKLTVEGCTFASSEASLGNIALGSTPSLKGHTTNGTTASEGYKFESRLNLQDFTVSIKSAQDETKVCYRSDASLSGNTVDNAMKGFDQNPVTIILSKDQILTSGSTDGTVTIQVDKTLQYTIAPGTDGGAKTVTKSS